MGSSPNNGPARYHTFFFKQIRVNQKQAHTELQSGGAAGVQAGKSLVWLKARACAKCFFSSLLKCLFTSLALTIYRSLPFGAQLGGLVGSLTATCRLYLPNSSISPLAGRGRCGHLCYPCCQLARCLTFRGCWSRRGGPSAR